MMVAIECGEGGYDHIRATVTQAGIGMVYQITEEGAPPGGDFIDDEGAQGWTDDEVREVVASYLGVTSGKEEIEVRFE